MKHTMTDKQIATMDRRSIGRCDKSHSRWQRQHDNFTNGVITRYKRSKYEREIALANEFCGTVNQLLTNGKVLYLADIRQGYSWKDKRRSAFGWLVVRSDCGGYLCFTEQPEDLASRSAKTVARDINHRFKGKTMDSSNW